MKTKDTLLRDIEQSVILHVDKDTFDAIMEDIICILHDYNVIETTTAIAIYTCENERLLQQYAACLCVDGRSEKTIKGYLYRLNDMFKTLQKNFVDVGTYDIRYYLSVLKLRGNANSTMESVRSYISAFYHWMFVEGIIQKNPCELIKPISYTQKQKLPFNAVEIERIRLACRNQRERAIVETLLTTGIRVSELEAMNISDIDLDRRIVHVKHGKGDKERTTFISAVAAYHLKLYLATRRDSHEELFRSKLGRLKPGGIRLILKNIESRCGVSNIHPHRFRRTFATTLNQKGMPIQHISQLLGPSNLDTTMVYVAIDKVQIQSEYLRMMSA